MTHRPTPTPARASMYAIAPILLGFVLAGIGRQFEFDGFIGGFLDGATVALMIFGATLVGLAISANRGEGPRGWWLPSRGDSGVNDLPAASERDAT